MGNKIESFDERLQYLIESLKDIEYGSLLITVHESQITQIERNIKQRFSQEKKTNHREKAFLCSDHKEK